MANIALDILSTLEANQLAWWDGACMELSDVLSQRLSHAGIGHVRLWLSPEGDDGLKDGAWFTSLGGHEWCYHVVVEVGGVVHDPWHPQALPRAEYLRSMFPDQRVVVEEMEE